MLNYEDGIYAIVESYRSMRTSIAINKNLKTILITSSEAGEGKTTTATNLARCFADLKDSKILLIDCDLRKPNVHTHFEIENELGLVDIITKDEPIEACINTRKNLHILTTGKNIQNPAEILEMDEMKMFIEKISKEYDYVFIDSPAAGSVIDACIIAKYVDGIILVSASNQTKIEAIKMTKQRLLKVNKNIIGTILNKQKDSNEIHINDYDIENEQNKVKKIILKIKRTLKRI